MATPAKGLPAGLDLSALDALTDAVESGAGLPEVVRAASRALDASLVCLDRAGAVLAVAVALAGRRAGAPATSASGVESLDLRVGDVPVGALRLRSRGDAGEPGAGPALLRLVATLVASEVERLRAPARASEQAAAAFLSALLERRLGDRDEVVAEAAEIGRRPARRRDACSSPAPTPTSPPTTPGARGSWPPSCAAPARCSPRRSRRCARPPARRGPRSSRSSRAPRTPPPRAPRPRCSSSSRAPSRAARSRSGAAASPRTRPSCTAPAAEALLAANVAEGDEERPVLAFEETGAYRLLLSAMSEDPAELQRFYAETVEPLVAYDEQYDTDLVTTVEAYLDADGNVAGTAARLFTHRHTVRYRLERVRELSGLDVGVDRRPREAVAGPEGDAGARRRPPRRPGVGAARGRARPAADLLTLRGAAARQLRRPRSAIRPGEPKSGSATADRLRAGLQLRPRSADADPMTPWPRTRSPRVRARLAAVAGVLVAALLIAIGVAGLNSSVLGVKSWPALQRADRSGPAVLTAPDSVGDAGGRPAARWAGCSAGGRAAPPLLVPGAGAGAWSSVAGPAPRRPSARRRPPAPGAGGPAGGRDESASAGRSKGVGTTLVRAADADGDGVPDQVELRRGMNPESSDSDGDGLPDGWEVREGTAPTTADASADDDDDGLSNRGEYAVKTDPLQADSNNDGRSDGGERPGRRRAHATRSRRASPA